MQTATMTQPETPTPSMAPLFIGQGILFLFVIIIAMWQLLLFRRFVRAVEKIADHLTSP